MLKEILDWVKSFAMVFGLVIGLNVFVFQPTKVQGSSMEPTLQNKETVFISKLPHTLGQSPDYGEIVILDSRVNRERNMLDDLKENALIDLITFTSPDGHIWIKRVIGKPGDVIELKDHKLYLNDMELKEPFIKEIMTETSMQKVTVPADHVFVMGDNRNNSSDSRIIGTIPMDHILGKMIFNP